MDTTSNGNSPRALVAHPEKRRSRPLTAYGLRRVSRERLGTAGPRGGLQALTILELELECGLELSGGQGDWS